MVVYLVEILLILAQIIQRNVRFIIALVIQHGVALTECAAAHLLATYANIESLGEEGADRERLGR